MKLGKTIVIHQPDFIPYLGFFHRLYLGDLFVVLDHVQLLVKGWHNRDKIKGPHGEQWLTVPIDRGVKRPAINEARVDRNQNWRNKHLQTISHFYKKAPYFRNLFPEITRIYQAGHEKLIDFNMAFLDFFCSYFGVTTPNVFSSQLGVSSKKSHLILDSVLACGGNCYLSGEGARDYLDTKLFKKAGVRVTWQDFEHPRYPQLHGKFIPYLSCLDFAMNCGSGLPHYLNQ